MDSLRRPLPPNLGAVLPARIYLMLPTTKLDEMRLLASVSTVAAGSTTLGVAMRSRINAWPKQMSSEQRANVFSCARTHRQNVLSNVRVSASAESTMSSGCTATQSCRRNMLPKYSMRLDKGLLRGSFQDVQRTAWLSASQPGIGTRECGTLSAQHTSEHSLQPNCLCGSFLDSQLVPPKPLGDTMHASTPSPVN